MLTFSVGPLTPALSPARAERLLFTPLAGLGGPLPRRAGEGALQEFLLYSLSPMGERVRVRGNLISFPVSLRKYVIEFMK